MTEETRAGATPNGGVKSTAFYQDSAGNPVDKSAATNFVIVEYDATGKSIARTYGAMNQAG